MFTRSLTMSLLLTALGLCRAAELPLGTVSSVDGDSVTVTFASGDELRLAQVLALYGPGSVVRHPLTDEVTQEHRRLVAKATIAARDGGSVRAEVFWRDPQGSDLAVGFDAQPLPNEVAPNSAPVLDDSAERLWQTTAQDFVTLQAPIVDPDGDPFTIEWRLGEGDGSIGHLASDVTGEALNRWQAPGSPAAGTVELVARDVHGHSTSWTFELAATALGPQWRQRELVLRATRGGLERTPSTVAQSASGVWWGLVEGRLVRRAPGWLPWPAPQVDDLDRLTAIACHGEQVAVLDPGERQVLLLAPDGALVRHFGDLSDPTDCDLAADGGVYVADRAGGGVHVFAAGGAYRARLGRTGGQGDAFRGELRLCLDGDGTVYVLDRETAVVHRWSQDLRRLPSWPLADALGAAAVDCAWQAHRGRLAVLAADGGLLFVAADGSIERRSDSVAGHPLVGRRVEPMRLDAVLADGLIASQEDGPMLRFASDGGLYGVRASSLWEHDRYIADARGHLYGLDASRRLIDHFDGQGWLIERFGGRKGDGGHLDAPRLLATEQDGSAAVVVDADLRNILRFSEANRDNPLIFASYGSEPGQIDDPNACAIDGQGFIYVLDDDNRCVDVFDRLGQFRFRFARDGGPFEDPESIAVSVDGKTAYVLDGYHIRKFALDHEARRAVEAGSSGGRGSGAGQFSRPLGVACDAQGLIYVVDTGRDDVQVLDFRAANAVVVFARSFEDLGIDDVDAFTVAPEGVLWLVDGGGLRGYGW